MLAISVDPPEKAKEVVDRNKLAFPVLCDTDREVIRMYGLVHKEGGLDDSDIAIPAHVLMDREGRIWWRSLSRRVQDRLHPADVLRAVRRLR